MQHAAVWRGEIAGDIAPLLVSADLLEGSDLDVTRDKMLVDVLADLLLCQSVLTERLGIVSGEAGVFKVSRNVKREQELPLLGRAASGRFRTADERHGGPASPTFLGRRLFGLQDLRWRRRLRGQWFGGLRLFGWRFRAIVNGGRNVDDRRYGRVWPDNWNFLDRGSRHRRPHLLLHDGRSLNADFYGGNGDRHWSWRRGRRFSGRERSGLC